MLLTIASTTYLPGPCTALSLNPKPCALTLSHTWLLVSSRGSTTCTTPGCFNCMQGGGRGIAGRGGGGEKWGRGGGEGESVNERRGCFNSCVAVYSVNAPHLGPSLPTAPTSTTYPCHVATALVPLCSCKCECLIPCPLPLPPAPPPPPPC